MQCNRNLGIYVVNQGCLLRTTENKKTKQEKMCENFIKTRGGCRAKKKEKSHFHHSALPTCLHSDLCMKIEPIMFLITSHMKAVTTVTLFQFLYSIFVFTFDLIRIAFTLQITTLM